MREQQTMDEIEVSTDLFLASVDALRESQVREPTLLPDWTRGHLITHVARAAESLCRLLDWARTGVEQQQYASADARARDIEAGARSIGPGPGGRSASHGNAFRRHRPRRCPSPPGASR